MEITISLAQLSINLKNFQKNVDKLLYLIETLPTYNNHILVLPELWSSGFTSDLVTANDFNLSLLKQLKEISIAKNLYIAGSYILSATGNTFSNRLVIATPNNYEMPSYDKLHLIASMNEKRWFVPGNHLSIANPYGFEIGLALCYDLRFPELFRKLTLLGAKLFILPSQWPEKRISHFQKLISARAIENQAFFVAANTIGKVGNTHFGGHSTVVDYFGDVQLDIGKERDKISSVSIDTGKLEKWRKEFQVLLDQRDLDHLPVQK